MEKRAVCLNCMDGRVQIPVINFIKDTYKLDNVDMITDPGMDGLLSNDALPLDEYIRKIGISIRVNNAVMIAVVGHHDCRGNPVSEAQHKDQIAAGVTRLKNEFREMNIIGLWVNSDWKVSKL